MNKLVEVNLRLIAAKAEQLAMKYAQGKLWEGDLQTGLSEIYQALSDAQQTARTDL